MATIDYRDANFTNQDTFNLFGILATAFDIGALGGDEPVESNIFEGYSFSDVFVIFYDEDNAIGFYGDNFTFDSDQILVTGDVTAFIEFRLAGSFFEPIGGVYDVDVDGAEIRAAFFTPSQDDDLALFAQGLSGDDLALLSDGDDVQSLHDGDDIVIGNAGNDLIRGGDGDDILRGGDGDDTLQGDAGVDTLRGGTGDDTLEGGDGGSVDDRQIITGDRGEDMVEGGSGADVARGGADNDTVSGGDGDDIVSGDAGDDMVSGGAGDDVVRGGAGEDIVTGGTGDDRLVGDRGDDDLDGGAGDDVVLGGAGDDTIDGGAGNDILWGRAGADAFVFGVGTGSDIVRDFENGLDVFDISAFTTFSDLDDVLAATSEVLNGVRIDLSAEDSIVIRNATLSDLTVDDFVFG